MMFDSEPQVFENGQKSSVKKCPTMNGGKL
jgi:hypothetical protein